MPVPPAPRRVLVVRLSHLGDVAQTLPLVHALREAWPDAEIDWAVQGEFAPLVAPLARPVPFDRRGGLGAWRRLRAVLAERPPDLVVDAQGNWKSAVVGRLARRAGRDARCVAFARDAWQEPLAARALPTEHGPAAVGPHLVARCCALAGHVLDAPVDPRLDPGLTPGERDRGDALLDDAGDPRAPVLLHPGVAGDRRSWPPGRFGDLARSLVADGDRVVVVTGPAEADLGRELEAAAPGARHLVGQRGLRELAALLDAARRRGGRIVVGDSGPMHVAASVGLPVVLLAGPEDPARTGPWPVIGARDSPHRLAAPPWTDRPITAVSVDDVRAALASPAPR